jgi:hypothetical protein
MNPETDNRIRPYFLDDDPVIYTADEHVIPCQPIIQQHYFSPALELTGVWIKALMTASIIFVVLFDKTGQPWDSAFSFFSSNLMLRLQMTLILCAAGGIITFLPYLITLTFAFLEKPIATLIAFILTNTGTWSFFYVTAESDQEIKTVVSIFAGTGYLFFMLFYQRWIMDLERNRSC